MKMKNDDLKKITEIKQYLLDPPVSFKLYEYALTYLQDAISVLNAYADAASTIEAIKQTLQHVQQKNMPMEALRSQLRETGRKLSALTNK